MRLHSTIGPIFSLLLASSSLLHTPVLAAPPPSQLEYAGIFIGQHADVLKSEFGKPAGESKGNRNSKYVFFSLEGDADGYVAFQFMPQKPDIIFSIQITGSETAKMSPFLGLKLGASKKEVVEKIGTPSEKNKAGKKELWQWKDRNYTMLMDSNGRLSSIKISGHHGFPNQPEEFNGLKRFYLALKSRNTDKIIRHIMPNIEIYTKGNLSTPERPLRKEVNNKNSKLMRSLVYSKQSVLSELDKLGINHPAAMRMTLDEGIGFVYRIQGSQYIDELVFSFIGGEWRLWKVYIK